jgi:hypothetical protein
VGGVVESLDALAAVVVADPPHEEGQAARGVVVERGDDLGDVERRLPELDQA